MHTYLLNNGESYSDYRVIAIVQSENPIDWPAMKERFAAALSGQRFFHERPDGTMWEEWNLPDSAFNETFEQLGVTVVAYEEVSFDVRQKMTEDYDTIPGEWHVV
jgi:hypothetical protein